MRWFNWLFPDKCVLCGKILEDYELDLCKQCRIDEPRHPVLRDKYTFIHQWTALWYYEDQARTSLLRYKFGGKRHYAASYGRLLAAKLEGEGRLDVDLITWIPISKKRRRRRGFDQVELLAKKLCEELGTTPVATLQKLRDNKQQSSIVGHAARRANVLGVYRALDANLVSGKRILLLDDILTTGATAGECARVLLTAGAKEVDLAVVAAVRHPKK